MIDFNRQQTTVLTLGTFSLAENGKLSLTLALDQQLLIEWLNIARAPPSTCHILGHYNSQIISGLMIFGGKWFNILKTGDDLEQNKAEKWH